MKKVIYSSMDPRPMVDLKAHRNLHLETAYAPLPCPLSKRPRRHRSLLPKYLRGIRNRTPLWNRFDLRWGANILEAVRHMDRHGSTHTSILDNRVCASPVTSQWPPNHVKAVLLTSETHSRLGRLTRQENQSTNVGKAITRFHGKTAQ